MKLSNIDTWIDEVVRTGPNSTFNVHSSLIIGDGKMSDFLVPEKRKEGSKEYGMVLHFIPGCYGWMKYYNQLWGEIQAHAALIPLTDDTIPIAEKLMAWMKEDNPWNFMTSKGVVDLRIVTHEKSKAPILIIRVANTHGYGTYLVTAFLAGLRVFFEYPHFGLDWLKENTGNKAIDFIKAVPLRNIGALSGFSAFQYGQHFPISLTDCNMENFVTGKADTNTITFYRLWGSGVEYLEYSSGQGYVIKDEKWKKEVERLEKQYGQA